MLVPLLSLTVLNTVVVPIGKVLPEGGDEFGISAPVQESLAVTVKKMFVGKLEVTTIFDGHAMETMQMGFTTVTEKLHMFVPLLSLAVLTTVVVPIGNVLPDGGELTRLGVPPHRSLAVTVKKMFVGTLEVTTMLEGQVIETQVPAPARRTPWKKVNSVSTVSVFKNPVFMANFCNSPNKGLQRPQFRKTTPLAAQSNGKRCDHT
jgi:hypothetical protein